MYVKGEKKGEQRCSNQTEFSEQNIKRDQQRTTFKNENKLEKCLKKHKIKTKKEKSKKRTNMQKQINVKVPKREGE